MKQYTTKVLVLGAALLWGSAAAQPTKEADKFAADLVPLFETTAEELFGPNGPVLKAVSDYIRNSSELCNDEALDDNQRAHAIGVSRKALMAGLSGLSSKVVALHDDLQHGKEVQQLEKREALIGQIYQFFVDLRKDGATDEVSAQHARSILSAVLFAGNGEVTTKHQLAAIAQLAGANSALTFHAKHPRLAQYALVAASAIAVSGMVYTAVQNRRPISDRVNQLFTAMSFGKGGKSISYNPVIDALFTPLQFAVHPRETWREKPVHVGVSLGLLGAGAAACGAVLVRRMRGDHMKPFKRTGKRSSRWASLDACNPLIEHYDIESFDWRDED